MKMLAVWVGSETRLMPASWWAELDGPKPDYHEPGVVRTPNNGCTASPDWYGDAALWPACVVHDWHYSGASPLPRNWTGRRRADLTFRRNLLKLMQRQNVNWFRRHFVAAHYFAAVRAAGWTAYNYAPGQAPEGTVELARERLGIFSARG